MKQIAWDTARARVLLEEGKSDLEVAEAVGVSLPALKSWKQRNGLARPRTGKAAADGQPKEEDATADTEPAKKNTPREVPVQLHMRLCGCEISIDAPDVASARRLLEQLL